MSQGSLWFFLADLSTTCEAAENQASFAQPVIIQPEIDIEVSEVCFVITFSKRGWDSRWKKIQRIMNIQKKEEFKQICFSLLTLTFTRFP